MTIKTQTKDESSLAQAYAQLESIKEMVEALEHANQAKEHERSTNAWAASEEAAQAIHESALDVQVRSGWVDPGGVISSVRMEAQEYRILLSWGDPAVRIVGSLNFSSEPVTATLEHQNWGTPWTDAPIKREDEETLLTYANQFYFGG